jgi:hypothetical protein
MSVFWGDRLVGVEKGEAEVRLFLLEIHPLLVTSGDSLASRNNLAQYMALRLVVALIQLKTDLTAFSVFKILICNIL